MLSIPRRINQTVKIFLDEKFLTADNIGGEQISIRGLNHDQTYKKRWRNKTKG
jgi:hypothetical protein